MDSPLPPHVAKAVRGHRRQDLFAESVGVSTRTLQRIEEGTADERRLLLHANAYAGAELRAGNLRNVAFLLECSSEAPPHGPVVPKWAHGQPGRDY